LRYNSRAYPLFLEAARMKHVRLFAVALAFAVVLAGAMVCSGLGSGRPGGGREAGRQPLDSLHFRPIGPRRCRAAFSDVAVYEANRHLLRLCHGARPGVEDQEQRHHVRKRNCRTRG